uniref:F-box and leucine-rich repeat protein 16 n=1 Tax=Callorhinchus milii TaxID=7868 RepID=A0A4W3HU60_CALMI
MEGQVSILDEKILNRLFWYFSCCERCVLVQVCKVWRKVLYQGKFWQGVTPILHAKELRRPFSPSCLCRLFEKSYPNQSHSRALSLLQTCLQQIIIYFSLKSCYRIGFHHPFRQCIPNPNNSLCEKISPYFTLNARITALSVSDCINVADDAIAAISQLLPNLTELNLQAYHVTDTAMAYFTAKQGSTTHTLRLNSCWEITNHGVVNMVHSLPNLTALSLSGCSKITDDGVELVAENLRKLRCLDLSWCPHITDMALEYIACDLHKLEEIILDSAAPITRDSSNHVPHINRSVGCCSSQINCCVLLCYFLEGQPGVRHVRKPITVLKGIQTTLGIPCIPPHTWKSQR